MKLNQTLVHGRKISKATMTQSPMDLQLLDLISLSLVLIMLTESQSMQILWLSKPQRKILSNLGFFLSLMLPVFQNDWAIQAVQFGCLWVRTQQWHGSLRVDSFLDYTRVLFYLSSMLIFQSNFFIALRAQQVFFGWTQLKLGLTLRAELAKLEMSCLPLSTLYREVARLRNHWRPDLCLKVESLMLSCSLARTPPMFLRATLNWLELRLCLL